MSKTAPLVSVIIVLAMSALAFFERAGAQRLAAELSATKSEVTQERATAAQLREQVARLEQDREKLRKDAAEVHRLRGEISTLREANKSLEKQAARPALPAQSSPPQAITEPQP